MIIDILVLLVAAKAAGELAERAHVPAVLGEIVAGIVIGPSVLGLVASGETLAVLAEIGVILLLLDVGMDLDTAGLRSVGLSSLSVALVGVVVPMGLGYGAGVLLGLDPKTALFVGAALTATSVGITARVLGDLGSLNSPAGRTVLGAAVADDVLGLIILTVVVRIVEAGSIDAVEILRVSGLALAFLVVAVIVGLQVAPRLFAALHIRSRSTGALVAFAMAFALGFSELAVAVGLAAIIGAFVAGLALARTEQSEAIKGQISPIGHLFVPVFFLQIGIATDLQALIDLGVLRTAGSLFVVAVAGKLIAGFVVPRATADRLLVGIGMLPRGEVGLIFAGIGLAEGALDAEIYGALLVVVLFTTLVTPPLLRWRVTRLSRRGQSLPGPVSSSPGSSVVDVSASASGVPAAGPVGAPGSLPEAACAATSAAPASAPSGSR